MLVDTVPISVVSHVVTSLEIPATVLILEVFPATVFIFAIRIYCIDITV